MNDIEIIEDDEICRLLDEATENAKNNPKRYDGAEVFAKARKIALEGLRVKVENGFKEIDEGKCRPAKEVLEEIENKL